MPLYTGHSRYGGRSWASAHVGFKFFTQNNPLLVSALGTWDGPSIDDSGTIGDGLMGDHRVRIWEETDLVNPIVNVLIPAGTLATLKDGFRYYDLPTPVLLDPYTPYRISIVSSSAQDSFDRAYGGNYPQTNATMNSYVSVLASALYGGANAPLYSAVKPQLFVGPNLLFEPQALPAVQTLINATAVAAETEWTIEGRIKEATTTGLDLMGPKPLTADGTFPGSLASGGTGILDRWESTGAVNPYIIWDLGKSETVEKIYFWNYNDPTWGFRGVSNATIKVADSLDGPWTEVETVTLNQGTGADNDPGQWVPLSGSLPTARYVMFTNMTAFYNPTYGFETANIGISEIAFYRVIPEPASLILLGASALLITRLRRRRRR